jgi:hypothetical protein
MVETIHEQLTPVVQPALSTRWLIFDQAFGQREQRRASQARARDDPENAAISPQPKRAGPYFHDSRRQ